MKSPFKFLDSFTIKDKDAFFGRQEQVDSLYKMVSKTSVTLVYGLSGTGKTSIIQCGLANRFDGRDWFPFFIGRGLYINQSSARAERRLRDASATAALAASAAANQAGVAGKCDAVAATANLLAGVLERIDSAASETGEAAVGISGFADKALGQRNECIARYRAVN